MITVLKPALENLDKALGRLEKAVEVRLQAPAATAAAKAEPQLDLSVRNEREVNRKIASRLDQTINRLEVLLSQD